LCLGTPGKVFSQQQLPPLTRLKYNNPGLVVDLGVELWAWPMPMDHEGLALRSGPENAAMNNCS